MKPPSPLNKATYITCVLSIFTLSTLFAAVRTVFSASVQEAATSSVCPSEEHCQRGVPESRVSVCCHYGLKCTLFSSS